MLTLWSSNGPLCIRRPTTFQKVCILDGDGKVRVRRDWDGNTAAGAGVERSFHASGTHLLFWTWQHA